MTDSSSSSNSALLVIGGVALLVAITGTCTPDTGTIVDTNLGADTDAVGSGLDTPDDTDLDVMAPIVPLDTDGGTDEDTDPDRDTDTDSDGAVALWIDRRTFQTR